MSRGILMRSSRMRNVIYVKNDQPTVSRRSLRPRERASVHFELNYAWRNNLTQALTSSALFQVCSLPAPKLSQPRLASPTDLVPVYYLRVTPRDLDRAGSRIAGVSLPLWGTWLSRRAQHLRKRSPVPVRRTGRHRLWSEVLLLLRWVIAAAICLFYSSLGLFRFSTFSKVHPLQNPNNGTLDLGSHDRNNKRLLKYMVYVVDEKNRYMWHRSFWIRLWACNVDNTFFSYGWVGEECCK